MEALLQKYKEICDEYHSKQSKYMERDICHYTNSYGLKGILENKSLWMTNREFLNDAKENLYWKEVFNKAFDEIKEKNCIVNDLDLLNTDEFNFPSDYIFSCTSEIDASHLWASYGRDGYAIIFNTKDLLSESNKWISPLIGSNQPTQLKIGIVQYNEEYQKALFGALIYNSLYTPDTPTVYKEHFKIENTDREKILLDIQSFAQLVKQSQHIYHQTVPL